MSKRDDPNFVPGTFANMTQEELAKVAWQYYKMVCELEREYKIYNISSVDFLEKDAILEIAGKNIYFQFDGEETPTLVDAIKYLVKEAGTHYD